MVFEIADLTAGPVCERVNILARPQEDVGRAGIDADAAGDGFGATGFLQRFISWRLAWDSGRC